MALQHLRSSTANKRPTPASMSDGQVAMNTNLASPGLFFKDSNGDLVKIGPVHVGTTAPNVSPAVGGQTGNSKGELWLDTAGTNAVLKTYNGTAWVTVNVVTSGTVVSTADTGTVTSTMILDGTILNADINASAAIADTKLGTISTADKVSLAALNIDGGTDIGAALADVDLFIVDDGGAGTNRKAAVTRISDYVFGKVSGDITVGSTGVAAIGSGVIVNADIKSDAAIVDTKLATISTAGKVSNSATTAVSTNTASAIVARDASGDFAAGTITAALTGNASTATSAATLTTARNIWGQSFNGSAAITGALTSVGNITGSGAITVTTGGTNTSLTLSSIGTGAVILQPSATGSVHLKGPSTSIRVYGSGGTNYYSFNAEAATAARTITLPNGDVTIPTGTLALNNQTMNIGTTSVAINRASANLALTGISSVALPGSSSGTVTVQPAAAAGTYTLTLPNSAGSDGQVLSTNGSGTLSWATDAVGFRNAIINGNFDIWQRGTSFTAADYGADRWVHNRTGTTHTVTRQAFTIGQTQVPNQPTYFCRTVVTSVAGAGNFATLAQKIEDVRTFAGQQVTISFWAKVDTTKNIAVELGQIFGSGGSPSTTVNGIGTTKVSIGTSWQKVTVTVTIPSISGKTLGSNDDSHLLLQIFFDAGSNFNARTDTLGQQSGTFEIAQVQVEPGPVATPFERRPIGTELALCQRYYEYGDGELGSYSNAAGNGLYYRIPFIVTKRVIPSVVTYSADTTTNVTIYDFRNLKLTSGLWYCTSAGAGATVWKGTWTVSSEL